MNKEYIPYVYLLVNKTTNLKYLGVRYARGCNPSDFWVEYFTSSSSVKSLIKEFGENDFYFKILHTFPNDPEGAILKEAQYFPLIKQKDDYLNMCYSSGLLDLRMNSKAGKVGGAIVYNRKIGIFRNEEEKREWCSMGGKVGGSVQRDAHIGIHISKENPELFKEWCSMGGKKGRFSLEAIMRRYLCTEEEAKEYLRKEQSERGKRGGIKNKGSKLYNDGITNFKYNLSQQDTLSFDEFLKQNTQFKKGMVKK